MARMVWAGNAAGGLIGGALLGFLCLPVLSSGLLEGIPHLAVLRSEPANLFWLPIILGAALGMGAALIGGAISQQRAAARRSDLAQKASRIGGRFFAHDAEAEEGLRSDFPQRQLFMENVLRKDLLDLRLAVGDLSIRHLHGTGANRGVRTARQTAAYFRRRDLVFPAFIAQPAGPMLKLASAGIGFQGLRFPSQPDFEREYFVLAGDVEGTRALLDAQVLAWLTAHPGLHVEAGGSGVLVYRSGEILRPEEWDAFIGEAAELLRLFERAHRQADLKPVTQMSPHEEARAFAAQLPSFVAGEVMKEYGKRVVTSQEVQAFLRQPAPRKIPANFASYCDDLAPMMVIAIGGAFAAMGALFAAGFAVKGDWGGTFTGALFLVVGTALLFFFGRTRWRLNRLLRRGEVLTGHIDQIEATGWSTNMGQVFNVSVRYEAAGQAALGRCKLIGRAADRAKSLAAQGKAVAILRDPGASEGIVIIDALVNAE